MRPDVEELSRFYASHLGQIARHLIARRVRLQWSNVRRLSVVGIGYPIPYLRLLMREAERVIALMPREQGGIRWPRDGRNLTALVDEQNLPLPDMSVDRLIAVHCLEMTGAGEHLLREFWRVLRPEGRLLLVVPNRRGVWARTDRTPFGHGHPYSAGQIGTLLENSMFTPLAQAPCVFVPPVNWRPILHAATAWERIGRTLWPALSGVLIVEAKKEVYGMALTAEEKVKRRRLAPVVPVAVPHGRCARLNRALAGTPRARRTGSAN